MSEPDSESALAPDGAESALAPDDAEFALLLTHDVDRPYKTGQSLYYAIADRDPRHLKSLLPGVNPWWQFEEILELEDELGVRSAFYFLREQHVLERDFEDWLEPFYWVEHFGRYEVETPDMVEIIDRLDAEGWEVGLHGSYDSYDDPSRLRMEKTTLEAVLGREVTGGRQHHLNRGPNTWQYHRDIGLSYDASPGSSSDYGFDRYRPFRPFGDEFVVFPLTLMEIALPDPGSAFETAWRECERLLDEADENDAVMSILWHPRMFDESDFPGFRRLYRRIVERALDMGAWVGSPGAYYDLMDHPTGENRSDGDRSYDREDENRSDDDDRSEDGEDADFARDRLSDASATGSGDVLSDKSSLRGSQAGDNKVQTGANSESTE